MEEPSDNGSDLSDVDDEDDGDDPITSYTQITGVFLYREFDDGDDEICLTEEDAIEGIEQKQVNPNRPFLHVLRKNDIEPLCHLWSDLVKDDLDCFIREFFSKRKQKDMVDSGAKYAYRELQRCMNDDKLVQQFRTPVMTGPQKLAALAKKKIDLLDSLRDKDAFDAFDTQELGAVDYSDEDQCSDDDSHTTLGSSNGD